MAAEPLYILFSEHAVERCRERLPEGHGLSAPSFVRLMLVKDQKHSRKPLWLLRAPRGILIGHLTKERRGLRFLVSTAFAPGHIHDQQRKLSRQFIPLSVRLFEVHRIGRLQQNPTPADSTAGSDPNGEDHVS